MKYNPHNYQKYAIEFIKQHPIAAILLDMGMGKTSIVLSALNELMYNSYIQRTELMQQSVAMVPSGSVREGSS